jgi:ferric-dicitrate binding protein FerR (iron transport regulator)
MNTERTTLARENSVREDSLEQLLRRVPPRRTPPPEDAAEVRQAVHEEWLAITGRRRMRRRVAVFASAASVLLALLFAANLLRAPGTPPPVVATIEKSIGAIYLLGDESDLMRTGELSILAVGQAVVTGPASGAALTLQDGGQLRIGADTRIEFMAGNTVFLESGRVYFDSHSSGPAAPGASDEAANFLIRTDQGTIAHVGTQFMVEHSGRTLVISVREGAVKIDGDYHDARASAGQRLTFEGRSRPVAGSMAGHGEAWSWVEATTPAMRVDNPTILQFLNWVARETGMSLQFSTPDAERIARDDNLVGRIDVPPTEALRTWMSTVDLEWRIEDGVIVVSE